MDRPRLIRGLRIAVSAVCGVLCVLSMVLWVRSYCYFHNLEVRTSDTTACIVGFGNGDIWISPSVPTVPYYFWDVRYKIRSTAVSEMTDLFKNPQYLNRVRFGISRRQFLSISVPCWFLTVISAALATAPWIRLRFSLRTLLIALTLIAVVLGLVVYLR
jgi:hypothetical protein